jgi:hypothetical protein
MQCNVGGTERAARIIGGAVLIAIAYLALSGALAIIAYVVGAIALFTGLIRFCPLNSLLGINTCKEPSV